MMNRMELDPKFLLDEQVYRLLTIFDVQKAWNFYCVFNPNSRLANDPFHGFDKTKLMLEGLYDYIQTDTSIDLKSVLLATIFHCFGHPIGLDKSSNNLTRALEGFNFYVRTVHSSLSHASVEHVCDLIKVRYSQDPPTSQSQKLIQDIDNYSYLTKPYVLDRLYDESKIMHPWLTERDFLDAQIAALCGLTFHTPWAKTKFNHCFHDMVFAWASHYNSKHAIMLVDDIHLKIRVGVSQIALSSDRLSARPTDDLSAKIDATTPTSMSTSISVSSK